MSNTPNGSIRHILKWAPYKPANKPGLLLLSNLAGPRSTASWTPSCPLHISTGSPRVFWAHEHASFWPTWVEESPVFQAMIQRNFFLISIRFYYTKILFLTTAWRFTLSNIHGVYFLIFFLPSFYEGLKNNNKYNNNKPGLWRVCILLKHLLLFWLNFYFVS